MPTDVAQNSAVRLGFGAALPFCAGAVLAWPLWFVGPVLAVLLLQAPGPMPRKSAWTLLSQSAGFIFASLFTSILLSPYPVLFLIALATALVLVFQWSLRSGGTLNVVMALLAVLLVPFLTRLSQDLAGTIALWLWLNLVFALIIARVAFALLPPAPAKPGPRKPSGPQFDMTRRLWRMSLAIVPFAVAFFVFDGGAALTLIFAAILSTQLVGATQVTPVVARNTLLANLTGGFAALLAYEATVLVPLPVMTVFASCFICLFFADGQKRGSAIAGSALTTALVLYGGSLGPLGDGADSKMIARLWQVGAALLYLTGAFVVLDHWLPERSAPEPKINTSLRRRGRKTSSPLQG